MKKSLLLLSAAFAAFSASAQISIISSSMSYTQDFNTLDTGGSTNTTLPNSWGLL